MTIRFLSRSLSISARGSNEEGFNNVEDEENDPAEVRIQPIRRKAKSTVDFRPAAIAANSILKRNRVDDVEEDNDDDEEGEEGRLGGDAEAREPNHKSIMMVQMGNKTVSTLADESDDVTPFESPAKKPLIRISR